MSNIVIVGSGPAGVSAALYAVRAGVQTTVLTKGSGALARAEKIENYYGFAQPVSGPELERRSIENARRLGVQFVQTEAVGLTWTDRLTVETLAGAYPADAVILATGASRAVPRIPGLTGLEGHGVSWCAACDAFFYRGKDVAVLGSGEYALHEVQALLPVVKSVTLLTNGAALTADFPPEVSVCTQKVEAILGEQTVTGVQLADGAVREVSGVFVALGVAGSTALARKLGAAVEGSRIVVDDKMQTTVPGLYAAGDCTGGLLQVAKAVYEGALRQGRPGAQPAGKLCGHPFAAQRAIALLSAVRGRQGRDTVPPVRRGSVHPVCLLRDGRGEHRPLHRRGGGHRSAVHQRGHLPTVDAGKRLCALLRLPDDGRALFRYHVDNAADFVHERRPAAGDLSDR